MPKSILVDRNPISGDETKSATLSKTKTTLKMEGIKSETESISIGSSDPIVNRTSNPTSDTIHFNDVVNVIHEDNSESTSLLKDSGNPNNKQKSTQIQNVNAGGRRQHPNFTLYNSIHKTSFADEPRSRYSTLDTKFFKEYKEQNLSITVLDYSSLDDLTQLQPAVLQSMQQQQQQQRRQRDVHISQHEESFNSQHPYGGNNSENCTSSTPSTPRSDNCSKYKRRMILQCNRSHNKHHNWGHSTIISTRYYLIGILIIFLISNAWWHEHIKKSQTPNPYYFWDLMYNNDDQDSSSYQTNFLSGFKKLLTQTKLDTDSIDFDAISSSTSSRASITSTGNDGLKTASESSRPYTPPTFRSVKSISKAPSSKLVVAGKMTVLDGYCNIAELSLTGGEWSLKERIQLSLYNSYSGGEVYSLLVNHTFSRDSFSFFNDNLGGFVNYGGGNSKTSDEKSKEQGSSK